ncbi:probable Probable hydrolase NIT3 [Saccharomycodes ludwigii]|uniref:Probable Probable hydrolase NIT3 n=1 Tax=Saccharomycodes ludwigii TaxID=36035 RepID=A0A376B4I7_9ASCO|nr:hypothetical protein SCDLUD_000610 [Saccharomycodes ludwigii]KAH3903006.1 hypothetical protein SCDLUD_000610 [Saccharomycodes ludwigii]SSD59605.1 probable Probable hydrolase NIT3 [Saccharomycodes ludwigii]
MNVLKNKVSVSLIQLAGSTPDKLHNLKHAHDLIAKCMEKYPKTQVIVLPECYNSPYAVDKFREYSEVVEIKESSPSVYQMSNWAKYFKIVLVGGSIPELDPKSNKVYNTCIVFDANGKILNKHRKAHLFDIDIPNGITFQESATLSGGTQITIVDTELPKRDSTVGQKEFKFGVGICYDMRFPELAMISSRKGCSCMIYPSAFNTVTGPLHWHLLARSRSIDNEIYTILCSPARSSDKSVYQAYGHSLVCSPMGEILCEAKEGEEILNCELDPEAINKARVSIPINFQRRFDMYPDVSTNK